MKKREFRNTIYNRKFRNIIEMNNSKRRTKLYSRMAAIVE